MWVFKAFEVAQLRSLFCLDVAWHYWVNRALCWRKMMVLSRVETCKKNPHKDTGDTDWGLWQGCLSTFKCLDITSNETTTNSFQILSNSGFIIKPSIWRFVIKATTLSLNDNKFKMYKSRWRVGSLQCHHTHQPWKFFLWPWLILT